MTDITTILIQLRMLADIEGDQRSLVAIAAQFERDAHCRNAEQAA